VKLVRLGFRSEMLSGERVREQERERRKRRGKVEKAAGVRA